MKLARGLGALLLTMFLLIAFQAVGSQKVPDQTVAKWTETYTSDPASRIVHILTVHSGVLEDSLLSFTKSTGPNGAKQSLAIKLSRVKGFTVDTFRNDDGSNTYRIGAYAKGESDLINTTWDDVEGKNVDYSGGMYGFANFGSDQQTLRDEIFTKLCAMIGKTPANDECP